MLPTLFSDDTKAPAINPELAAADQLYRAGKFAEAEASYQTLLKADAKLVPAHVGLVRAMLRQQKAYLGGPHPDDEEETKWMTGKKARPEGTARLSRTGAVVLVLLPVPQSL